MDEEEALRVLTVGIEFAMAFIELGEDDPKQFSKALANSALMSLEYQGFRIIRISDGRLE